MEGICLLVICITNNYVAFMTSMWSTQSETQEDQWSNTTNNVCRSLTLYWHNKPSSLIWHVHVELILHCLAKLHTPEISGSIAFSSNIWTFSHKKMWCLSELLHHLPFSWFRTYQTTPSLNAYRLDHKSCHSLIS